MFSNIHELLPQNMLPSPSTPSSQMIQGPTLPLTIEDYQIYVAFLFQSQSCEQITSDNHMIYLVKTAFDHCLDNLGNEELFALTEKEDMYLNDVMYNTFKSCLLCTEEDFEKHRSELLEHYDATDDETLFIDKIEHIIAGSLDHQISPFTYLKAHEQNFSPKVRAKLTDMLKFIIGDSMAYLLEPNKIFGLCLKWTLDRYSIKNQHMHQLVQGFIDVNSDETTQKLSQITGIMNEILNMTSQ